MQWKLERLFTLSKQLLSFLMLFLVMTIEAVPAAEPVDMKETAATAVEEADVGGLGRVIYDQRQTGKYNIHVSIKDVAIIEMDQNEVSDDIYDSADYYYDDADLTVKPLLLNPITQKPVMKSNITTTTTSAAPITTGTFNQHTSTRPVKSTIADATVAENLPLTTDLDTTDALLPATNAASISTTDLSIPTTDPHTVAETLMTENPLENSYEALLTTRVVISRPSTEQRINNRQRNPSNGPLDFPIKATRADDAVRADQVPDSQIFNMKMHRAHKQRQTMQPNLQQHNLMKQQHFQPQLKQFVPPAMQKEHIRYPTPLLHAHRCRANQYRDLSGNCQIRRAAPSSSAAALLRKFFNMLVTLPLSTMHERERD